MTGSDLRRVARGTVVAVTLICVLFVLAIGLAACGGGGGPSDLKLGGTPTTTAVTPLTDAAPVPDASSLP